MQTHLRRPINHARNASRVKTTTKVGCEVTNLSYNHYNLVLWVVTTV